MFPKRKYLRKKNVLTRRLHSARRNRLYRVLGILLCIMLFLVFVIALVEVHGNDSFKSIGDVIYWAIVTITTVGYGDITPKTPVGQQLTLIMILIGVILMSFTTATIASILTATRIREGMGLEKIDIKGHIIICGYNYNIERVIKGIIISSSPPFPELVLINSHQESEITDIVERFPELSIRFVHGDYTAESTLKRASLTKASSAIILADTGLDGTAKPDDRTLLATLAIKSMSQDVKVCVELLDASSEVHLTRAGVDQFILSGEFSGFFLANAVIAPGIPEVLKELMNLDKSTDILRQPFPRDLVGTTFPHAAREFLDRYGSILIGVITEKQSFNLETILTGEKGAIDDFIRRKFDEAGRNLEIESKGRIKVNLNPGDSYSISEYDIAVVLTPKAEKNV